MVHPLEIPFQTCYNISMPILGETKRANELGYKSPSHLFQWCACIDCEKERWVRLIKGITLNKRCRSCARRKQVGKDNPSWKGGRISTGHGYMQIFLFSGDFFFSMVQESGYVPEHRLVMAKHLGRCLHRWEIVHHKNHIKDDNRIENLQLVSDDRHKQITTLEMQIKKLKAENQVLREKLIVLEASPVPCDDESQR